MLLAMSGAQADAVQWSTKSPMPAPAGQAALVAGQDGRFYLLGGYNTNPPHVSNTRKLQIYDPRQDVWSWGADLPYFSVGDCAIQAPDGKIHLFNNLFDKIVIYDPIANAWQGGLEVDWIRYASRAVRTEGDRYFIFGGERAGEQTMLEYFPETGTVVTRAPVPYVPDPPYYSLRYPGAYAMPGGFTYVIGGLPHLPELHGALDDVARYDPASDTWLCAYTPMPTARFSFGYVRGWNGFLYAIGGSTVYTMQEPPYYDIMEHYDPVRNLWQTDPSMPQGRRECAAAIDSEGVIYVFGGSGPPNGDYVDTVYAYVTRVGVAGPAVADFDRDGDVDLDDLLQFESCATGPALGPPVSGCENADFDRDGDVDQCDFGVFQTCISGPDVEADPTCSN